MIFKNIKKIGNKLNIAPSEIKKIKKYRQREKLTYPIFSFILFVYATVSNFISSNEIIKMNMSQSFYPFSIATGLGTVSLIKKKGNLFLLTTLTILILYPIITVSLKPLFCDICSYGVFDKYC
jgi:hypothetical protein